MKKANEINKTPCFISIRSENGKRAGESFDVEENHVALGIALDTRHCAETGDDYTNRGISVRFRKTNLQPYARPPIWVHVANDVVFQTSHSELVSLLDASEKKDLINKSSLIPILDKEIEQLDKQIKDLTSRCYTELDEAKVETERRTRSAYVYMRNLISKGKLMSTKGRLAK